MLCLASPIAFFKWSTASQLTHWGVDDCLSGLHLIKSSSSGSTALSWRIHCTKEGGPHLYTTETIVPKDSAKESMNLKGGIYPFSEIPCLGSFYSMSWANLSGRKENRSTQDLGFCHGSQIVILFLCVCGGGGISILICKVRILAEVISKYPSISTNSKST